VDGDTVGSLRVISTPGHSPGHVSYLDERDGTLIAGDAVTTIGRVAVTGDFVWQWPFLVVATWHKPTARESARRLLDAAPATLATGHGPVVGDATAALRRAVG
jgi:glyoxylase-like metal-dependent hydrolase (beta-lactamase superfamily II)